MTAAAETVNDIYNFEAMTDWLGTSGQPRDDQFRLIAQAGYNAVINLALPDSDRAVPEEGRIVTSLGMSYHHLPVVFDAPTFDDLTLFYGLMHALAGKRIWVHCVVNARVSAFVFHYLTHNRGLTEDQARSRVLARWEPEMAEVWRDFLTHPEPVSGAM